MWIYQNNKQRDIQIYTQLSKKSRKQSLTKLTNGNVKGHMKENHGHIRKKIKGHEGKYENQ